MSFCSFLARVVNVSKLGRGLCERQKHVRTIYAEKA